MPSNRVAVTVTDYFPYLIDSLFVYLPTFLSYPQPYEINFFKNIWFHTFKKLPNKSLKLNLKITISEFGRSLHTCINQNV